MAQSIKLSVVVPAYQEATTIVEALSGIGQTLLVAGIDYELIVVCDGCTDGTGDAARTLTGLLPLRVIEYPQNRGKGHALAIGSSEVTGDCVAFFDADLDIDPSTLVVLFTQLLNTKADGVVGSKFHKRSSVNYPLLRRTQSKIFMLLVFILFRMKIRDTQTGAKVFQVNVINDVVPDIKPTGFGFDVELMVLAHDRGYRIEEGPVRLTYQYTSSVNLRSTLRMLREVAQVYQDRKSARNTSWSN